VIFNLTRSDIDNQLSELYRVAGAFQALFAHGLTITRVAPGSLSGGLLRSIVWL
jgi:hypothetical protein